MNNSLIARRRRSVLQSSGALMVSAWLGCSPRAAAQTKAASAGKPIVVAQIVDVSEAQQDVAKDFLIGSRAAWQDINLRGGVKGRKVTHQTIETDGSAASVKQAFSAASDNPDCVALCGTVGDPVASQLLELSRVGSVKMAHVAPWLQNSAVEVDDHTFPIFAGRLAQITHALESLSVMGLKEIGAVYGSERNFKSDHLDVERTAVALKLKLRTFQAGSGLRALGQKMADSTPGVLLFIGGTPELSDFAQGLALQSRQRYIVALGDVNLQVLSQMGVSKGTPIIATQPVPLATNALPLVRSYRETMARLFDEPPTSLSLAGFIAARYCYEVLGSVDAPLNRQSALLAFQKRAALDLDGFRITFDAQRRSGKYVTQSMLGRDGRLIG